jgi:Tol biopolymer transport system component
MDPDGMSQVNLSEHPASDLTPDISPNGRFVAFSSNRMTAENPEGDYEIFVMALRNPSSIWQVTSNTGLDSWPRWSPDGETIVFETRETAAATSWEIYRYTLGDDKPVRLTTNNVLDRFPEWSSRGELLVIRRVNDIHLIASGDGSDVAQLTYDAPPAGSGFPAAPGSDQMASFSPNGKLLTWMSARNGYPSVFVMRIDEPEIQIELTPRPVPLRPSMSAGHPAFRETGSTFISPAPLPKPAARRTYSR